MSTIVGVEKGGQLVIAWDAMRGVGSTRAVHVLGPPKVVRVGRACVGCTGFTVYYNLLDHYVAAQQSPPPLLDERDVLSFFVKFWRALREDYHLVDDQSDTENRSPFADLAAEFLIAGPGGLFIVKEIMSITRFSRFCAIGSGAPHAEGALEALYDQELGARQLAQRAMDVALAFDAASCGPVEVLEITGRSP